jgi:hypothetical protein
MIPAPRLLAGLVGVAAAATAGCFFSLPDVVMCDADLQSSAQHCGQCNHGCLGGTCMAGQCQPVVMASGQKGAYGLTQDTDSIFWVNASEGTVRGMRKNGDATSLVTLTSGLMSPKFACSSINDRYVYVTVNGAGTVVRLTKIPDAEAPRSLATKEDRPWEIACDQGSGGNIYFTTEGGNLKVVSKGGANLRNVATGIGAGSVAIDSLYIYWTERKAGSVRRIGKDDTTGAAVILATNQLDPDDIAVDSENVYWTSFLGGTLSMVKKTVSMPATPTEMARGQASPNGLAWDAEFVYWTTYAGSTINKIDRQGGQPIALPGGPTKNPIRIVVDSTSIYWTNETGTVIRLAK